MLIQNIGKLVLVETEHDCKPFRRGKEMEDYSILENAWLRIEGDRIVDFGVGTVNLENEIEVYDAKGGVVLPSWCDSHTHLVFAAPREAEFVDKILGKTYAEIAAKGGGILNSARKLNEMSEEELYELSKSRLKKVIGWGTGAIEIKSGYGLNKESELKMLRVIKRLKQLNWIPIKSTFLGAHALPLEYKNNKEGYLDYVLEEILPAVVDEGLADYIDVFCEDGFFDREDTKRIIEAGNKYGLKAKIHANQLNRSGGVQVGVENGALSVDHLETMGDEEIEILKQGNTFPVALPGAAFFLRMSYPPVRRMIEENLPVVVASDYNPGSCPCGNMNTILKLSCIQMKMTPREAICAMTINGAAAMELSDNYGSIKKGKVANLTILKNVPSIEYVPYSFGEELIQSIFISGKEWNVE